MTAFYIFLGTLLLAAVVGTFGMIIWRCLDVFEKAIADANEEARQMRNAISPRLAFIAHQGKPADAPAQTDTPQGQASPRFSVGKGWRTAKSILESKHNAKQSLRDAIDNFRPQTSPQEKSHVPPS